MSLARSALLWISENRRLRESLPRYKFIRKAVSRFMPGEELSDAIRAAQALQKRSITTIFTRLGENVTEERQVKETVDHYIASIGEIRRNNLDTYVSVKLTQLGLDQNEELCYVHLARIASEAEKAGTWLWIDMEQSPYVDRTLALYKRLRSAFPKVGVCLQAYLYRTEADLRGLLPLSPAIRLVKGAYKEPTAIAFASKADVDANFLKLSEILLDNIGRGVVFGVATHDKRIIDRINSLAAGRGIAKTAYEFQLLYGIRSEEQQRLADQGYRMRCLISYGSYWFPWYVRRLAERPANVWFVLKNALG